MDWKVLDVTWSDEQQTIVVYYFEVGSIDADELEEIKKSGNYGHDSVEHSSVSEVVKWIKRADGI